MLRAEAEGLADVLGAAGADAAADAAARAQLDAQLAQAQRRLAQVPADPVKKPRHRYAASSSCASVSTVHFVVMLPVFGVKKGKKRVRW